MSALPRALVERERAVLLAMIRHGRAAAEDDVTDADRERWEASATDAMVTGTCSCGECPSVELLDARGPTPGEHRSRVVLGAETRDALLLLFIDDDRLRYLEAAPLDAAVEAFPAVEAIDFA